MSRIALAPVRRLIGACLLAGMASPAAAESVRHRLSVALDPATHSMAVTDRVEFPAARAAGPVEFLLNAELEIRRAEPAVTEVPLGNLERFLGARAPGDPSRRPPLKRYRSERPPGEGGIVLSYGGTFDFGLSDPAEEYTRGFRETYGIVGPEGVFLSGSGFWVPFFDDGLVEFDVEVALPEGWHVISQGDGTSRDAQGRARWDSGGAMDEVYLVGGPLQMYREAAGAVEALVYLHEPDEALASKYLTTTARYVEMYRNLIGPYPYTKFALVENFWETGYGMPSFTVLGPKVIRFPFILHSSYPHEILHNWWGNSVFVDYARGNWCEGLTAYLADHLVKEQRGEGENHRRDALQKYRSYVGTGRDFPLSEFRSRHDAATEAVGYGKTLMLFHMLRRTEGDDAFRQGLARFYRSYRGRRASFDDIRKSFEEGDGTDLRAFFAQWVERSGAPSLTVSVDEVSPVEDGFSIRGTLRQIQDGPPFDLDVPVVVATASGTRSHRIASAAAETGFVLRTDAEPRLLIVDPHFDLFRLLDPREIPPSIGSIFGARRILAVLPSRAPREEREAYRSLVAGWRSDDHEIEIALDSGLDGIPAERSVWVLGRDNRFADELFETDPPEGLAVAGRRIELAGNAVEFHGHSIVAIRRHPADPERAIGWLVVDPAAAFPGMGRKLPHYGRYSYLAFEGDEPTNVVKGQWPASGSPLRVDLRPPKRRGEPLEPPALEERVALAELPPVFSLESLMAHVRHLASPEHEGRGLGSQGLRAAAEYIAERFEAAGLAPGGDDGGYFQRFTVPEGPEGEPVEASNVVGYLEGARESSRGQSVVIGAHYDHLGRGWPDVHQGDEGRVHPGADDNASGVAVLLELARTLAESGPPSRSIVFAAFAAEEAGKLGSRHYVEHEGPFPSRSIRGVINLDTVGRLLDGEITVLGTGTADEWQHIFRGCSFVTGVRSKNVPGSADGSDQQSFIDRGIPAVQIFTRAHEDYHRPGDTADKVDGAGLVRVATFVKEAVAYLAEREEPLTVTIAGTPREGEGPAAQGRPGVRTGRRVRFGTFPDFAFPGPGVKVDGIVPGSPAERAGIRKGDLLIRIGDTEIENLRAYSDVLKGMEPGQTVRATVVRDGLETELVVTVEAR